MDRFYPKQTDYIEQLNMFSVDIVNATEAAALAAGVLNDLDAQTGSTLVGHIDSEVGAVATTVQAKLRTFVADGDYDTAQNAALAALGKVFFAPPASAITLTIPTNCATLAAALTAIARWVIPDNTVVTIQIPTGAIALSASTVINHPYGAQIAIVGAATVTTTASAAGAVTGSAGAWAVPLTVASGTGIAANDYVILRNVTGTGRFRLFAGLCKVTSVVSNTVTITNTAKNAAWPTAALSTADITVIKTVITYTGCDGFKIDGPLGSLNNIAIVGDKTASTIGMIAKRAGEGGKGNSYVYCGSSFGISGFGDGGVYAQYNGNIDAPYLAVADCLIYNVHAQHNGAIMMNGGISSGSTEAGISAHSGGSVSAETSIACGNGTYGIFAQPGGSILAPNAYTWANVSDGWRQAWGGNIRGQALDSQYNGGNAGFSIGGGSVVVPSAIASNNAGAGLYAEGGATICASSATASSNGSYGMYCDGSVIDAPNSTTSSNTINGVTAMNNGTILADALAGTGNGTYLVSASKSAFVRATSATGASQTFYSETGGLVDATNATGTPTLTKGVGGMMISTAGALSIQGGAFTAGSVSVNGATLTSTFNSAKDSIYSSESSASMVLQNITAPLKMLYGGYDNTRDYAFFQSVNSTNGYKPMALQPNGANVAIGMGATLPTARLHLAAGTATAGTAPLKLTAGTNLTSVENGAFEYDGTDMTFATGGVRVSLTRFIQAGTGAVATTAQARLREEVSATDFSTLQQALNTGKVVRLVDGVTYPVTSQLTIPSGGGIVGRGTLTVSSTNFPATTKVTDSTGVPILALSVTDITLRDFKIVVTAAANSYINPIGIRGVTRASVRGIKVTGLNAGSCVMIDSSFGVRVIGNDFYDCEINRTGSTAQLTGVEVDDNKIGGVVSESIMIARNRVKNLTVTAGFLTAYDYQTDGINIKVGAKHCVVIGNVIDGVGEGIDLFCEDSIISNNVVANTYLFGIKLIHGASRNTVSANKIIKPGLGGIVLAGSSSAAQNTDGNTVKNNTISGVNNAGNWTASDTYAIGINADGTYKATNNVVENNFTVNSTGADYNLLLTGTGTGNVCANNRSDGTPVTATVGSGATIYLPNIVGDSTGAVNVSGTAPTIKVDEIDAAADERIYDTVQVSGDQSRRTRTDANGTGVTYEHVLRTGTAVDLIRWHGTAIRRGGVTAATRYEETNNLGAITQRYDDNSAVQNRTTLNYGIDGSAQGFEELVRFGAGGVLGATAFRTLIVSTADWASAGNRSSKVSYQVALSGALVTVLELLPTGCIIKGTTTNDSAASTIVGELITATVAAGSAVSLTTATGANVTSISLTAGDWDVSCQVEFVLSGATSTLHQTGISATSATLPTQAGGSGIGTDPLATMPLPTTVLSGTLSQCVPPVRVSLAATTTIYLVAQSVFSVGTETAYGTIRARRMR